MIRTATGDWQRRIPPWADTHSCDVRRYRGPYVDTREELARKGRAITCIYRALGKARRACCEFLVIRLGERAPRRDALHRLVRDFACSPEHQDLVDLTASSQYADRLVLALRAAPQRARPSSD